MRGGELKRRMPPISKKVLNQHLRRMEKDGRIVRTELKAKIPHVEYALTNPLGRSIPRLLQVIAKQGASELVDVPQRSGRGEVRVSLEHRKHVVNDDNDERRSFS